MSKYPSTEERINKIWNMDITEYHTEKKLMNTEIKIFWVLVHVFACHSEFINCHTSISFILVHLMRCDFYLLRKIKITKEI